MKDSITNYNNKNNKKDNTHPPNYIQIITINLKKNYPITLEINLITDTYQIITNSKSKKKTIPNKS